MKSKIIIFLAVFTLSKTVSAQSSLEEFLSKKVFVISVEQKQDIVTAFGYQGDDSQGAEYKIRLKKGEVFAIWNRPGRPTLSVITIPFKVRSGMDGVPQTVSTGLTNAGLSFNFYNKRLERHLASGKKSSHNFGIGVFIVPSSEDLKSANTNGKVTTDIRQLFISNGLVFSYSYNDLTFAFVPAGWDLGTADEGKAWIYNKKRWWGFGIGINTKLFGF